MLCWGRADACATASTYTMATACAAAASGTAAAGCAINHCSASGTLERLLSPMLYIFLQSRRLRQLGKFLGVGPPGRCRRRPPRPCRRRGPPSSRSFWPRKRLHNHTCAIFWGRRKKKGKKEIHALLVRAPLLLTCFLKESNIYAPAPSAALLLRLRLWE